ncbi:hypothetical protein RSAG8_07690, partial [Rhizoctonia solani AG-8 WAC10335]
MLADRTIELVGPCSWVQAVSRHGEF